LYPDPRTRRRERRGAVAGVILTAVWRCRTLLQPGPGLATVSQEGQGAVLPLLDDEVAAGDAVAATLQPVIRWPVRPGTGRCRCHRLVQEFMQDKSRALP